MSTKPPPPGLLDLFTRQGEQNALMLNKLDALLFFLRNDLPPLLLGEVPLTTYTSYITEQSGGFSEGSLGLGDVVKQDLVNTVLQRSATQGYIYCETGTITLRLNDGDPIHLAAGLTVTLPTHPPRFKVFSIEIQGEAAGTQFRMVLY